MCDSRSTIDCHESSVIHGKDGSLTATKTHKRRKLSHNLNQKEGKRRKISHNLKRKEGNDDGDKNNESSSHRRKRKRRHSSGEGYCRRWVCSKMQSCLPSQDKFIIMSYNILGEDNASNHSDLYCQIPSHILDWKMRKRLICQELSIWKPDVVCLQEVDHFDDLIKGFGRGYIGIFKGRTGEARDGCAIFWRKHLFSLLQEESIEFKELGLRDNVAQLCVFEMNQKTVSVRGDNGTKSMKVNSFQADENSRRRIVVGNIHVLFNPKRGDVKLGQVRVLLQKAHELSERWGKLPVVIGGDFNSTPQSAMYQFLASSELDILAYDRRQISGLVDSVPGSNLGIPKQATMPLSKHNRYKWSEDEVKTATGTSGCRRLKHPLNLCSAYASVKGSVKIRDKLGEPLATSCHSKFMGTVDYIWHSKGLIPVRVLDTLPLKVLRKTAGLPTMEWGSDHLALACELTFSSY